MSVHDPSRPVIGAGGAVMPDRYVIIEDEALQAGFTQIPNQILRRADIQPGAKLTYRVLLSYAWQQGSCYPSQDRLAEDMGVSECSVITYLKQLTTTKLITIIRRGLGLTNVYVIHRIPRICRQRMLTLIRPLHKTVRIIRKIKPLVLAKRTNASRGRSETSPPNSATKLRPSPPQRTRTSSTRGRTSSWTTFST